MIKTDDLKISYLFIMYVMIIEPVTDTLWATIPKWGPSFKVSLDLKINAYGVGGNHWNEIIRFTTTGHNFDRIVALFTNHNGFVHIDHKNRIKHTDVSFEEQKWYHLELLKYEDTDGKVT